MESPRHSQARPSYLPPIHGPGLGGAAFTRADPHSIKPATAPASTFHEDVNSSLVAVTRQPPKPSTAYSTTTAPATVGRHGPRHGVTSAAAWSEYSSGAADMREEGLRPLTALAPQTTEENQRMAELLMQINSYMQSGLGASRPTSALSTMDHEAGGSANMTAATREMILHELLHLQHLVDAVRTGDFAALNSSMGGPDSLKVAEMSAATEKREREAREREKERELREKEKDRDRNRDRKGTGQPASANGNAAGNNGGDHLMLMMMARPGGPRQTKSAAGRKSIRLIAEELAEKIHILKSNASQWEVFCARVAAYKAAKRYNRQVNVLQRNVREVVLFEPATRQELREIDKRNHEERRKVVSAECKRIFEERQRYRQQIVEKAQKQLKVKPANPKLYQLQQKWLILGSLASRIFIMQGILRDNHTAFLTFKRQSAAARRIQRAWRRYKEIQLERRKKWAIKVLGRAMSKFIASIREQRKQQAANTIRVFLKEIHDVGKLLKVIKKYRYAVITAQRVVRGFLSVRMAQLQLLQLQWGKMEVEFWASKQSDQQQQQPQPASGSADNLNSSKNGTAGGAKGGKKAGVKKKREEGGQKEDKRIEPVSKKIQYSRHSSNGNTTQRIQTHRPSRQDGQRFVHCCRLEKCWS
ncbi:hypothetical protein BCR44DRAFT_1437276 [Catenaria anguillulae PL171]|uniref:Uncharacterized protein n=1 Tax=Catenaria anguillulae PL171 TaxID=765915 RepID=A0A1Y2HH98_9FUNG|nr:hypothetical protein BCR44DRAFT_1437276 [Catenaria anguillulae PL171]